MKRGRRLVVGCEYSASGEVFRVPDALRALVATPALLVVAAAASAGVGPPSAINMGASGGIVPVACLCFVTAVTGVFTIFVAVKIVQTQALLPLFFNCFVSSSLSLLSI